MVVLGSVVALLGPATAAAGTGEVQSETANGNLFLGNEFIELGILPNGGFGSDTNAPASFAGNSRGQIGMYADFDGFDTGEEYQYDYFLPGTPEERFSVGFKRDGTTFRASNGRNVGTGIADTTVTDSSDSSRAKATVSSSFEDDLEIIQTYELRPSKQFYIVNVTLTNNGAESMNDVRYQRSFDPDNGQDVGCDYTTNNTVLKQPPEDAEALVKAEIMDSDTCDLSAVSSIPVFYYTASNDGRVSTGEVGDGLVPASPPYGADDYDSAPTAPRSITEDTYIALTFEQGTLNPGESVEYTYYVGLTDDIDATLADVDNSGTPQSSDGPSDPEITDFFASVDDGTITVGFDSSESLVDIDLDIDGPDATTLDREDFTGDRYEGYRATVVPDAPGEYTVTLLRARDGAANDGVADRDVSTTVTIAPEDTPTPTPNATPTATPNEPTTSTPTATDDNGAATSTPTLTPTATPSPTPSGTTTAQPPTDTAAAGADGAGATDTDADGAGFGVWSVLAALGSAAYLVGRRRTRAD